MRRVPGLDIIRACAIILVVWSHFRLIPRTPYWFKWIGLRGHIGVDLFFVLSGWLIGGQLLREVHNTGHIDFVRFWSRRWLRTLPSYFAVMLLLIYLGHLNLADVPKMAFFTQNYLAPLRWIPTWSLCIEEHFYLVLPLIAFGVCLISRPKSGFPVALVIVLFLLPPLLRAHFYSAAVASENYSYFLANLYEPTHLRFSGLTLGVGLAALREWRLPLWEWMTQRMRGCALTGIGLIVGSSWNPLATGWTAETSERMGWFAAVPAFSFVSIGVALTIPLAVNAQVHSTFWPRIVSWISEHAYSIYLTHMLALDFATNTASWYALPFGFSLSIGILMALALSSALRSGVEKPGLRLRDRNPRFARKFAPQSPIASCP